MDVNTAIERFRDYYEATLVNGRKTATEKARRNTEQTQFLLSQMPGLGKVDVTELTDERWLNALRGYIRTDRMHRTQADMFSWPVYGRLRNAIIFARDDYTCAICGRTIVNLPDRIGLSVDHIEARCNGGGEALSNLRCVCLPHNMAMGKFGELALVDAQEYRKVC
jgi:hypothetical protein